jgi:hypothetical protein
VLSAPLHQPNGPISHLTNPFCTPTRGHFQVNQRLDPRGIVDKAMPRFALGEHARLSLSAGVLDRRCTP